RRIGLLLILRTLQGCLPQAIHVSQAPAVNTTEGSTVTLHCNYTFNITNSTSTGYYDWHRHVYDGPEVSGNNAEFKGRISKVNNEDFMTRRRADIELKEVMISDTGMYICNVILLATGIISGHGNGTFLLVSGEKKGKIKY
uniref:Natural cytotoxicity triggering receptor 3 n=1 Tax=Xenopus tropicalis TaxID=8364 RepID=A0A803JBN2_XENTR